MHGLAELGQKKVGKMLPGLASFISGFQLRHSDGRVGIWHKQHGSLGLSCLVSWVQAGSAAGGVMAFMTTADHHLMATARGQFTMPQISCCLDSGTRQRVPCTSVASIVTTSHPYRAYLGFAGMGEAHPGGAAKKICSNCLMLSFQYGPRSQRSHLS